MSENRDQINTLLTRLEEIISKQESFEQEILAIKSELLKLKNTEGKELEEKLSEQRKEAIITRVEIQNPIEENAAIESPVRMRPPTFEPGIKQSRPKSKSDLEKFIGENLINKIGILITILGVVFGAKYSIDHDLISPLTRIVLGYLLGLGLLAFGIKLKAKYDSFSAVLVSGAMATLYFVTYTAFGLYNLIPQSIAFALMVIFTVFTVFASIKYNQKIIALIGLVGAYAVPFLLSDGSGRFEILLSYVAIINIGVLVLAFRKHWKLLYYLSFSFTWLILLVFCIVEYRDTQFALTGFFTTIYFIIFYITFIAYKLLHREQFKISDVILLMLNSFIFYGIGYWLIAYKFEDRFLGIFTLLNAILHFIVVGIIRRNQSTDKNIVYLIAGLVLVFITLTIPVQLEGNWVTLIWISEATLLFWIGRSKGITFFEKLSYPMMLLSSISLLHDWGNLRYSIHSIEVFKPIFNAGFMTSALFALAFLFIIYIQRKIEFSPAFNREQLFDKALTILIPGIFIVTLYFTFLNEITSYSIFLYEQTKLKITNNQEGYDWYEYNHDLFRFASVWSINYTLFFTSSIVFINYRRFKRKALNIAGLVLLTLSILQFLGVGLFEISELRESYVARMPNDYYHKGVFHLIIRYISIGFGIIGLIVLREGIKQSNYNDKLANAVTIFTHVFILWLASSELIGLMHLSNFNQTYKLGLSILWGLYAVMLIALGIWKKKQFLRLGAIVLFSVTLLKLFFYDISHLDTISKTIVFVSLGIFLLIISFLYNKFKNIINEPEK